MIKKQGVAEQRRSFLKGVAAAGGAAVILAASREAISGESDKPKNADEKTRSKGYRKTPHVKDYYASLRV